MKIKQALKRAGLVILALLGSSSCTLNMSDLGGILFGQAANNPIYTPKQRQNLQITSNLLTKDGNRQHDFNVAREGRRPAKARASGKIHKVWVDYDAYENGKPGMKIHARFSVFNNQGYSTQLAAYFKHGGTFGGKLKDKDGLYASADGQVSVCKTITPPYQNTSYNDFTLSFPYSQLDISRRGKHSLAFKVKLWDTGGAQSRRLSMSPQVNFHYTK